MIFIFFFIIISLLQFTRCRLSYTQYMIVRCVYFKSCTCFPPFTAVLQHTFSNQRDCKKQSNNNITRRKGIKSELLSVPHTIPPLIIIKSISRNMRASTFITNLLLLNYVITSSSVISVCTYTMTVILLIFTKKQLNGRGTAPLTSGYNSSIPGDDCFFSNYPLSCTIFRYDGGMI